MKRTALTVIVILIMHAGFGQANNTNQTMLDSISHVVIHYLQIKQSDSIYALAGQNFKSHITAEDFKSVSQNQIFPLNNFQGITYVSTVNGINKYKVQGTPDLQLLISLDKENKLETLLIQPYSDN